MDEVPRNGPSVYAKSSSSYDDDNYSGLP